MTQVESNVDIAILEFILNTIDKLRWLLGVIAGGSITYFVQRKLAKRKSKGNLYGKLNGLGVLVTSQSKIKGIFQT